MAIEGRTTAAKRVANARRICTIALVLMLTMHSGCRRGAAPNESVERTSPPPAAALPIAQPIDAKTAPSTGAVEDPPPVKGAALPAPTVATSSSDATSASGELPILRAVRVGEHEGLDRVVFEFDGHGLPAWRVEYVDGPVADCGAGNTVPVAGEARLRIRFSGAQAHTQEGRPTSGPARRAANQPNVTELVRTCDFEGEVTWVAGLAHPTPYTPRVLSDPSRLVIDIAH